jgi:hypothetical protein
MARKITLPVIEHIALERLAQEAGQTPAEFLAGLVREACWQDAARPEAEPVGPEVTDDRRTTP